MDARTVVASASLLLIGVPDRDIEASIQELAARVDPVRESVALHLSGSLTSDVLGPLRARGYAVGSFHPNLAFPVRNQVSSLAGVGCGIEGDAIACDVATELCRELHAVPLPLSRESKALYHAAASVVSNFTVTLFDAACRMQAAAGIPAELSQQALLPLLQGTVQNLARLGSPQALTGPIERGDLETVRGHLRALRLQAGECLPLYVELARRTVELAVRRGTLKDGPAGKLRALLDAAP